MGLVIDSIEFSQRGAPLFKSVHLELHPRKLCLLYSHEAHVASTLLDIINFRKNALNSYVAIDGQKLYRKTDNMVLLPAGGLLPKNVSVQWAFKGYGCSWSDFSRALPNFKAGPYQKEATLSSGERRMCELYLCLHLYAHLPHRWIFLDQPFLHLSPVFIETAANWIETAKTNAGILLVDGQTERPQLHPDSIYTLHQGRIVRT